MKRYLLLLLKRSRGSRVCVPGCRVSQSGHFVGTPTCTDIGTQLTCEWKVAGLGGTTFELTVEAQGSRPWNATIRVETLPRAGHGRRRVRTGAAADAQERPFRVHPHDGRPDRSRTPTCPNNQWTPHVADVTFGDATLSLFEDKSSFSDQITVPVSS